MPPYLKGGMPRKGWSGGGNCGGGSAQILHHDCYASPRGKGPAGTARADRLHVRATNRIPDRGMKSGLKGMCEEPVLYEGLPGRLPCGGQASQESLADEAALCPKAGAMPPTCADQPGLTRLLAIRTDFLPTHFIFTCVYLETTTRTD